MECKWDKWASKRGQSGHPFKIITNQHYFLQETHLKNDSHGRLRCRWIQQIQHSNFSMKAGGAAILIHRAVPFKHISTVTDKEGRYGILWQWGKSTLHQWLLNIFGPNSNDLEFFRKVLNLIPDMSNTNLIIGVDFNLVLDPYLDRSSTLRVKPLKACKLLKSYIENMNLFDIWQISNASGRKYSFHSKTHNV